VTAGRGKGAPFAVSKGNEGAPSNGELMIVIERKISGRMSADQEATKNADAEQFKAILAAEIIKAVDRERLTVRAAHKRTGIVYLASNHPYQTSSKQLGNPVPIL
jgi:hypothetical protein